MSYLGHLLAGIAGAVLYYAYVRFDPNASTQTPNPLPFRKYIRAEVKVFFWGLAASIFTYFLWILLHRLGVAVTVPADVKWIGGKVVAVPAMNWLVAFFLGFAGRTIGKLGPRILDTLGAVLRRFLGFQPSDLPPATPKGES